MITLPTIHAAPAQNHRHRGVYAGRRQKQASVLYAGVIVYNEEQNETSEADGGAEEGEGEAMADSVGHSCNDHSKDEGAGVRRDVEELCSNRRVTISLNDSRREVC